MANDNDMVVRQVGLTFALLASPEKRDVAWVQKHVDGYGGRTRDAATHLIERDVRELRPRATRTAKSGWSRTSTSSRRWT